jgi:hypothetical protein
VFDFGVELLLEVELTHVAVQPPDRHAPIRRPAFAGLEERLARVEPGDLVATIRQLDREPTITATDVEVRRLARARDDGTG